LCRGYRKIKMDLNELPPKFNYDFIDELNANPPITLRQ
jgi:hypothetical protein